MKRILAIVVLLVPLTVLRAQDVITLKTGETINAKVTEVGINEIRYYKAANADGPVYVVGKWEVAQIVYKDGTKDVFNVAPPVQPSGTQPQSRVIVQRPVRRVWPYIWYPPIVGHIDLGHHFDIGHHGGGHYGGGHHGGGHH